MYIFLGDEFVLFNFFGFGEFSIEIDRKIIKFLVQWTFIDFLFLMFVCNLFLMSF